MALGGIGGGVYYFVKQNTETKESQTITIEKIETQIRELEEILVKPEHADKILLRGQFLIIKEAFKDKKNSLSQDELKDLEKELKKMKKELEPNNPDPTPPDPEETIEQLKVRVTKQINDAINSTNNLGWAKVKNTDLFNNWTKRISEETDNKENVNLWLKHALKDINQLKTLAPKERQKLKDYFVFCPNQELDLRWVDSKINVRDLKPDLVTDLNVAIKNGNSPQPSWQRKYMAFTKDFNINSQADGHAFDNWVNSNPNLWIAIKKNHNASQYSTERNIYFLRKGETDYHEFNTRRELATFLDSNDDYFKNIS
jgi:hypothetical protein